MKPVKQTVLHSETTKGNCFTACVASIFELQIEEVPNFIEKEDFWNCFYDFIRSLGYDVITYSNKTAEYYAFPTHNIMIGTSPRNPDILHAVVGFGNDVVFDPHPDNTGLVGSPIERYYFMKRI